ncbi:MAG: PEP-CTERM sorting domain-containing protein [Desulfobacterium sp.]|jgi:hypothetical protein|nr:PEP-CTERM sorting domain-containing protein [Desulfobacterium sp.]
MQKLLLLIFFISFSVVTSVNADIIVMPYNGSFDEVDVVAEDGLPAGDYDTIGGFPDVGLFNLVAGNNTFKGSVWAPKDSGDVFLIGIGAGQALVGANILFGTNLTPFTPMFAFPAPQWTLEESDSTPTIFNFSAVGWNYMDSALSLDAPLFLRGEGIYNVFLGNGTFGINSGNYETPIDYTMTFIVESDMSPIPEPTTIVLFGFGLLGLAGMSRRKKQSAPTY